MVYKIKGQFILNEDCLRSIIDRILKRPDNENVIVEIDHSPYKSSKSLYVRFYIGDCTTSLRISDHKCKGYTRQIIVGETTGIANVCYKIECAINDLKKKRLYGLLEGVL